MKRILATVAAVLMLATLAVAPAGAAEDKLPTEGIEGYDDWPIATDPPYRQKFFKTDYTDVTCPAGKKIKVKQFVRVKPSGIAPSGPWNQYRLTLWYVDDGELKVKWKASAQYGDVHPSEWNRVVNVTLPEGVRLSQRHGEWWAKKQWLVNDLYGTNDVDIKLNAVCVNA